MEVPSAALDQLAATPKRLANIVAEANDARLDTREPGERSARLIMAHLRDGEYLSWRLALERILAEPNPELSVRSDSAWESTRNTSRDRKEFLLADFALQRQASLGILNALRAHEWEASGTILQSNGQQILTVAMLVTAWASHDTEHLEQIEAVLGETYEQVIDRRMRRE